MIMIMAHGKKLNRRVHLRLHHTLFLSQLMDTMTDSTQVRHCSKLAFLLKTRWGKLQPNVGVLLMIKIVLVVKIDNFFKCETDWAL